MFYSIALDEAPNLGQVDVAPYLRIAHQDRQRAGEGVEEEEGGGEVVGVGEWEGGRRRSRRRHLRRWWRVPTQYLRRMKYMMSPS